VVHVIRLFLVFFFICFLNFITLYYFDVLINYRQVLC